MKRKGRGARGGKVAGREWKRLERRGEVRPEPVKAISSGHRPKELDRREELMNREN